MGLLDKIEELQKKPESYRKTVLAVLMVLIMSVIILVWLSTMNLSGGNAKQSVSASLKNEKISTEYAPLGILKDAATNIKNLFNKTINKFKK